MAELSNIFNPEVVDSLTRLPGPVVQQNSIEKLLDSYPDKKFILAILDVDYLKQINDNHGRGFGDYVLREFSKRLLNFGGRNAIITRTGGDEFIIFQELTDTPVDFAIRLLASVNWTEEAQTFTCSIGLASTENVDHRYGELFLNANKALYRAKLDGRNRFCIYDIRLSRPGNYHASDSLMGQDLNLLPGDVTEHGKKIHIFIVNTYSRTSNFTDNLREKLKAFKNLTYYVFSTRYSGEETELVQKIHYYFPNEDLRFYCCGGSGSLQRMINGLPENFTAEIAFYPCGKNNDYLQLFGSNQKYFSDISKLIYGDVIKVDYIKTNHGLALNHLAVGLSAHVIREQEHYKAFGSVFKWIPKTMAGLRTIQGTQKLPLSIFYQDEYHDIRSINGKYSQILFGNANTIMGNLKFSARDQYDDGLATFCAMQDLSSLKSLSVTHQMKKGNMSFLGDTEDLFFYNTNYVSLRREDDEPFMVELDGELQPPQEEWTAEIISGGLSFVVPREITRRPYDPTENKSAQSVTKIFENEGKIESDESKAAEESRGRFFSLSREKKSGDRDSQKEGRK